VQLRKTAVRAKDTPERADAAKRLGGGRVKAVEDWIGSRADTSLGRLAPKWSPRYLEASDNSGSAVG